MPDDQNRTTCVSDVILLQFPEADAKGAVGLSACCLERSTDLGGQGAGNDHQASGARDVVVIC
jgi:hypothetical protein